MRAVPLRRRWVKAFSRGCGAEAARSHGGSAIHLRGGSNAACKWTPIRVRFAGPFRKPRYLRGGSGAEYFCYVESSDASLPSRKSGGLPGFLRHFSEARVPPICLHLTEF
ncbi:unnamed protein product [Boreogadus saida]